MVRAILIDDEVVHHDVMKHNLATYCPDVKVVAELTSGAECLETIPRISFDILIMDIELGDMNSFEVLQQLALPDLHVIFITSFDKYALQAFKVHAVDYLLKPIEGQELALAIERAMTNIINRERQQGLVAEYSIHKNNKLVVADSHEYRFINIQDIAYCKACGNYTDIYHIDFQGNEVKFTDTHNLKFYEEKLEVFGFIRIHQSYLVNKDHVSRIRKNPFEIILLNHNHLPVARERKHIVLDYFTFS